MVTASLPPSTIPGSTSTTLTDIDTQTTRRLPKTGTDSAGRAAAALLAIVTGLHLVVFARRPGRV
jgi:hypothetical protein